MSTFHLKDDVCCICAKIGADTDIQEAKIFKVYPSNLCHKECLYDTTPDATRLLERRVAGLMLQEMVLRQELESIQGWSLSDSPNPEHWCVTGAVTSDGLKARILELNRDYKSILSEASLDKMLRGGLLAWAVRIRLYSEVEPATVDRESITAKQFLTKKGGLVS